MHQKDPISCSTRKNMALDLAFFPPYNSKQVEIGTAKEEIHVLSFGNLPIFRGKVKNEWLTQPILRKIDFLNGGEQQIFIPFEQSSSGDLISLCN